MTGERVRRVNICRTCGCAMTDDERGDFVDQCGYCAVYGCTDDCPEDCTADHRGES